MRAQPGTYYAASGTAPVAGLGVMAAAILVVPTAAGVGYGILTYLNPFIYLNVLGTIGLGWLVGKAVAKAGQIGKVRCAGAAVIFGSLAGLVACYAGWVGYLLALSEFEALVLNPLALLRILGKLSEKGIWSIHKMTPTGIVLWSFWLAELGILVYFAAIQCREALARVPFCEECERWTAEEQDAACLEVCEMDMLRQALEARHWEVLTQLDRSDPASPNCLRLNLHVCPECANSNFLTVRHVVVTVDSEGKKNTSAEDVAARICIPAETVAAVRAIMKVPLKEPAAAAEAAPGGEAAKQG